MTVGGTRAPGEEGRAEALSTAPVEELLRALVKAVRAFQMYLPNNPMYQRAEQGLQAAFRPVWELHDELALSIVETEIHWEEAVVYSAPSKSESFAWVLYKDGMRHLTLRRGVERQEIGRFLQIVSRARLLAADAGDDLLTLLWEQDFEGIQYRFAEVITDPGVLDPQALMLDAAAEPPEEIKERVRQDPAPRAKVPGVVDLEDFDSTLYFLDDAEIQTLQRELEEEYRRDVRQIALDTILDILELVPDRAVREEVLQVFDILVPSLLTQGAFRETALLLREFATVIGRVPDLLPEHRERLGAFESHLSEPAIVGQLVEAMDEVGSALAGESVADLIAALRPQALEALLTHLPQINTPEVRSILTTAAERLAGVNTGELLRLLRSKDSPALEGLVQLCGRLKLAAAVPGLTDVLRHEEALFRRLAVEALGQIGSPGALAALDPSLDDPDRTVRLAAVGIVGARGYKGALRRLEAVVAGKEPFPMERSERLQFFEAYADVAGTAALKPLTEILLPRGLFNRKANPDIRTCAAYAIGRIRTPEAREILQQAEKDKELTVRNAASRILRAWTP